MLNTLSYLMRIRKTVLLSNDEIPFTLKDFNTKIFDSDSVLFWKFDDKDSAGYFVFKNSFYTAILKYDCWHYSQAPGDNDNIIKTYEYGVQVYLPLSSAIEFFPVTKEEMKIYRFKVSSWFPTELFMGQ